MKRTLAYLATALAFCLLLLALSLPSSRTVKAADDVEKCNDCLQRVADHYNQCIATLGETDVRCGERFNQDIINCYRNFCEQ
jgi:hypothetical protein